MTDEPTEARAVSPDPEAPTPAKASKRKLALPATVRLTAPYGYWTDDGALRQWAPGVDIEDPTDIADLIERQAPIEGADDVSR